MKIKKISASIHQFPVYLPMIDKPLEHRVLTFVEVETESGLKGCGITGSFLPWALVAAIENDIFPVIKDMDVRETEALHSQVWWKLNPRSYTGVISNALSAIDIACWDIRGKAADQPLHRMLGGARDAAPTYITFGYPFFDRDQLVEYAKKFVAEGNTRLKMVVACDKGGWREDAKRIRAVRDAVGDDIDIMIDANYRFTPWEARMLCNAIEDCRISWFEEPLHQNDARALADLRRSTKVPLSAGQMEGSRWRYREFFDHQSVDIVQMNAVYNGGITESQKVGHMAQAYNMPVAVGGGWPIFNMHLMAGLSNGWLVEYHWGMWQAGQKFFIGAPEPENDQVILPEAPGLGFTPNYDALKECHVKGPDDLQQGGMQTNTGKVTRV